MAHPCQTIISRPAGRFGTGARPGRAVSQRPAGGRAVRFPERPAELLRVGAGLKGAVRMGPNWACSRV